MKNNNTQVKSGGLPVVSQDEQVQRNSMKLYIYLVSISTFQGKNKPRIFTQRDFNVNKIHKATGLHDTTIKKYWRLLEENGLVKYEGPSSRGLSQKDWEKAFMARKNNKASYYSLPKSPHGYQYRIIPKETLDQFQKDFLLSEQEIKLFLLLANMQEQFCYMSAPERIFTIADLRILLGLSKDISNNKSIANSLFWLEKLNLIQYDIEQEINNLGKKVGTFHLKSVNYYTDGGDAFKCINNEEEKIPAELKEKILTENLILEYIE